MIGGGAPSVLLVADEADARVARELLHTAFPTADVQRIGAGEVEARRIPQAPCAVIAARVGTTTGLALLRSMRAAGFTGGAVVLAEEASVELVARVRRLGGECLAQATIVAALPAMVIERSGLGSDSHAARELRQLQRLAAMGEVAAGFQHEVNNPLTALLAEAQLLELEPMDEPWRAAVGRIVELCRRVVATVRQLDAVRTIPDATGARPGADEPGQIPAG